MSASTWAAVGAFGAALAVAAGAFGAHGLEGRLDERSSALWDTAVRYLMVGSVGIVLAALAAARWPDGTFGRAAWSLAVGSVVFSGTVAGIALGGPRWLGAVTPVGGLLLILGFALFGWEALRL